jgi:hypothetical protein
MYEAQHALEQLQHCGKPIARVRHAGKLPSGFVYVFTRVQALRRKAESVASHRNALSPAVALA